MSRITKNPMQGFHPCMRRIIDPRYHSYYHLVTFNTYQHMCCLITVQYPSFHTKPDENLKASSETPSEVHSQMLFIPRFHPPRLSVISGICYFSPSTVLRYCSNDTSLRRACQVIIRNKKRSLLPSDQASL